MLTLALPMSIAAENGGIFVSRGSGMHPRRTISSYELIFVTEGTLSLQEENRRFDVGAGQSLILWPDRLHYGASIYDSNLRFFWVHFKYTAPVQEDMDALRIPQLAVVARPDHLKELFRRFLEDQEAGCLPPLQGNLQVMLMLCEVCLPANVERKREISSSLAGRADALIQTNFADQIGASSLAAKIGCNANYLNYTYRQTYQKTLTEAIHDSRLRNAVRLLVEENLNVNEVSSACGFSESGYFRRVFKNKYGMTPLAFRRLYARAHMNTA
jgi:AraC-like DNA-binding protein